MIEYQKRVLRGIEEHKEEIERLKQQVGLGFERFYDAVDRHQKAMHDKQAELEQLKMTMSELQNSHINSDMNLKLATDMIEQLKEALKKCDPNHGFGYCYSCDAKFNEICKNKENGNNGHRENCEYVRLTGGCDEE